MKCKSCGFENLKDSDFCQDCGQKLDHKSKPEGKNKPIYKEIEDIVFVPKNKSSAVKVVLIVIAVLIGGFILLVVIDEYSQPSGSVTSQPIVNREETTFPLSELSINNIKVEWRGYGRDQLYFVGTLKNTYYKAAKSVRIRLDFYYDKESKDLFDTRYFYIYEVAPNGARALNELVLGFFSEKQFWTSAQVESAEF